MLTAAGKSVIACDVGRRRLVPTADVGYSGWTVRGGCSIGKRMGAEQEAGAVWGWLVAQPGGDRLAELGGQHGERRGEHAPVIVG